MREGDFNVIRCRVEEHDAANECRRRYNLPLVSDTEAKVLVDIETLRSLLLLEPRVEQAARRIRACTKCSCPGAFEAHTCLPNDHDLVRVKT